MFLLHIFSQVFVVGSHLAMPNTGRFSKFNLGGWSLLIASSPYLGPCVASFLKWLFFIAVSNKDNMFAPNNWKPFTIL
jgi:hypothetical protein